jgi:hypothetical protein
MTLSSDPRLCERDAGIQVRKVLREAFVLKQPVVYGNRTLSFFPHMQLN